MTTSDGRRTLEQHVATGALMGVDFVPVGDADANTDEGTDTGAGPDAGAGPGAGGRSKIEALEALRVEHDASCPHCTTATGHTQTVFGEGNPDAAIMFVGEAPGAEEDRTGRPFVGRAGQKLDGMINAMGLERSDVYIANVLKTRPPNNRTPLPDEVGGCSPFLMQQVRIIEPEAIVCLGGPATKLLLNTNVGITRLRGTWASFDDGTREIAVMPTFHPAYLLRNYTRDTREKVWSDLKAVLTRLGLPDPQAV